jgi:hypothetical protein
MNVAVAHESDILPPEIAAYYTKLKVLPDGRVCGVHRLLYHWTMHVAIDWVGYRERYCYATREGAEAALDTWDGRGDPEGWHRHPETGRRRDPKTGKEWIDW